MILAKEFYRMNPLECSHQAFSFPELNRWIDRFAGIGPVHFVELFPLPLGRFYVIHSGNAIS